MGAVIVLRLDAGETAADIARTLGVSRPSVVNAAKRERRAVAV